MSTTIGFIGGGNMASALINGILTQSLYDNRQIIASVTTEKSLLRLENRFGIQTTLHNLEVVDFADLIILAVKPYKLMAVLEEIQPHLTPNHVLVSIASGVTLKKIESVVPHNKIYRVMPNTPAAVNLGMTSICTHLPQDDLSRQTIADVFSAIGKIAWIDESLMHAAIAVHGSSPAYAYMMIEAMADAAVLEGLPRDMAYMMAAQSLLGAAEMVLSTGLHPGALKDQVTSPGGNTIAAIAVLEETGFRSSIIKAMQAAAEKSREMEKR